MAQGTDRQSIIDEITALQKQQLETHEESALHGYTPEQSLRAFDARFNRMAILMHRLAELDEVEK